MIYVWFLFLFSMVEFLVFFFFFSSRRRHTRWNCDWSSDVCSSDLSSHVEIFGSIAPLAWRPGAMQLLYAQQYGDPPQPGQEDIVLTERVGDGWRERPLVTGLQPSDATYPRSEERRVGKEGRSRWTG